MSRIVVFSFYCLLGCCLSPFLAAQPGCPAINAGPDQNLDCNNNCTTLTATPFPTGATTSYAVSSIPYSPPYPFNQGTQLFIGIDDIYSALLPLPFPFCFYGNTYNNIVVGTNGLISFNAAYANQFCPWAFTQNVPNAALPLNAVFGVYQDIDPSVCGQIRYTVQGQAPCRNFVVNFNQVCHFSCTFLQTTTQIVLYETTNVIEVYVQNKPLCPTWNGGRSIIGIQNATGAQGLAAPGRNSTPVWSANNEAWRFSPNGAPAYTVEWFEGGNLIGTGNSIGVCVTSPTLYTATVTYDGCGADNIMVSDDVLVNFEGIVDLGITPSSSVLCPGQSVEIQVTGNISSVSWSPGAGLSSTTGATVQASPNQTTTYTATVLDPNGCELELEALVVVAPNPVLGLSSNSLTLCPGESDSVTASGAEQYVWSPAAGLSTTQGPTVTIQPGQSTTYTIIGISDLGCESTIQLPVTVAANPVLTFSPQNPLICEGEQITMSASGASQYNWAPAPGLISTSGNQATFGPLSNQTYTVEGISAEGCVSTADITVEVFAPFQSVIDPPGVICASGNSLIMTAGGESGTWSGTGITNASTGQFSPQTAGAGNHQITFVPNNPCALPSNLTITVTQDADATVFSPGELCLYEAPVTLQSLTPGGTWAGPGIIDPSAGLFNPTVAGLGVHTVFYTVGNPCPSTQFMNVLVSTIENLSIVGANQACLNGGQVSFGATEPGGLWSGPGIANVINGTFNPIAAGPGVHQIQYTILGDCGRTATHTITVHANPVADFSAGPLEGCVPVTVNFTNLSPVSSNCQWLFNGQQVHTGCDNFAHSFTQPGFYNVTLVVTDGYGCSGTMTEQNLIYVAPYPNASFSVTTMGGLAENPTVETSNHSFGATQYLWTVNGSNHSTSTNTMVTYLPDQTSAVICLKASNEHGCEDEFCRTVNVKQPFHFYIPNAFTPGNDDLNEVFIPVMIGHSDINYLFIIHDRWGQEMFRTNDPEKGWIGNHPGGQYYVQPDVYAWRVEVGELTTPNRHVFRGHVTVVR
jgi:hypothetical protein